MNIKDNIWKFGIYSFINNIKLVWMISTLYILWLGFKFTNIGIYETIFAISIVLFELPTGVLADFIGKKKAIIISCILNGLNLMALGLMTLPIHYYFIALIMGIAFSFRSGADIALLYDSLKKLNRAKEYKKIRGKINAFNSMAKLIGIFLGPILYTINPRLGFLISGIIYILAGIIISTMVEPYKNSKKVTLKNQWKQILKGLKDTIKHKQLMWLIGFFFVANIGIELFLDFWQQPILINNGFSVKYFGIIFAILITVKGITAWFTHRIENKLKEIKALFFILILQATIFIFITIKNSIVLITSLIIFYAVISFQSIIFEDYINKYISSKRRATILSIKSFIYNIITAGIYSVTGILMDSFAIHKIIIGTSIFILIGTFILYLSMNMYLTKNKNII